MFAINFKNKIEDLLKDKLNQEIVIESMKVINGGSINNAYCIDTNVGKFFIKTNYADKFPNMFEKESKGLELLRNTNTIFIPELILTGSYEENNFLILEFIDGIGKSKNFWESFGIGLAKLHLNSADKFGLDHSNYIGSLHQNNQQHDTWDAFFINERLLPQIEMARNNNRIDAITSSHFEHLFSKLKELFPNEKPALLHGDLWSGNFMVGKNGEPVIMDPAVYYGHREMDLAMTKLFGGFDYQLYESYNEHYPLENGWESRVDICNLYPLMVHVNLFGGSYLGQVKHIVSKFD